MEIKHLQWLISAQISLLGTELPSWLGFPGIPEVNENMDVWKCSAGLQPCKHSAFLSILLLLFIFMQGYESSQVPCVTSKRHYQSVSINQYLHIEMKAEVVGI